ncbi:MAG: hypothetical protein Q8L48_25385 [Archangium sp.]|nr:hypothetical protein [Archangium sp.]
MHLKREPALTDGTSAAALLPRGQVASMWPGRGRRRDAEFACDGGRLRLVAGVDGFLREALHAEVIDHRLVATFAVNAM